MSNAQDLLSILGGRRPAISTASSNPTEKSIMNFKAGKMTTTLKPNGKYLVAPDTRRGEIHLVWSTARSTTAGTGTEANNAGHLKVEWKDRRTKAVVNTVLIMPGEDATFERVETGREGDRVYLLQVGSGAEGRHFFW